MAQTGKAHEEEGEEENKSGKIDVLGPCDLRKKTKNNGMNPGKGREMHKCMYWWICLRNNVRVDESMSKIGEQFKW